MEMSVWQSVWGVCRESMADGVSQSRQDLPALLPVQVQLLAPCFLLAPDSPLQPSSPAWGELFWVSVARPPPAQTAGPGVQTLGKPTVHLTTKQTYSS